MTGGSCGTTVWLSGWPCFLYFYPHLEMGQERALFVLSNRVSSGSIFLCMWGSVVWGSNSRLHTCQVRLTHTQINNFKVASGTFTMLYNHSGYLGPKHFVTQKEALHSSSPSSSFALLPNTATVICLHTTGSLACVSMDSTSSFS